MQLWREVQIYYTSNGTRNTQNHIKYSNLARYICYWC